MSTRRADGWIKISGLLLGVALLGVPGFSGAEQVGLWSFDGNAEDTSGFDHHGEVQNGASFSDDVPDVLAPGQSLQVNGGQQHVLVQDSERLDLTEAVTISAWVKPVGELGWDGVIAKNPSEGSDANHAGNYELRIDNGTRVLHFLHQQGGGNDTAFYASAVVVPPDVWSHVAVTAQRGGELRFYLNGELAETFGTPVNETFGAVNDNPLYIGSRADLFTTFDGFIDEVSLYDTVLEAEDIELLASGPADPSRQPDRDGDGIPDAVEERLGFLDPDNPADGLEDEDEDGVSNAQEFANKTDLTNPDTDGDGLGDGVETNTGVFVGAEDTGTNPRSVDTDGDGLSDGVENNSGDFQGAEDPGTSPVLADTDGDAFGDFVEVTLGSNPVDAGSSPEGVVLVRSAGNNEDWNTPEIWSDGQAPQAGVNYLVVGNVAGGLRTPRETDPVFAGAQLSLIGAPSELLLQHTGLARVTRIGLDSAVLRTGRAGESALGAAGDIIAVTAASTIGFDTASTLRLGARLEGASPLLVEQTVAGGTSNAVLVLEGADNPFSGDWTVRNATLRAAGVGSLGSGDIFLEDAVFDADYNVSLTGGALDIIGEESRIVLDQILAFGAVTLNAGAIPIPEGVYDYDAISDLFGGGLIETFIDGGGLLVIGGDVDADGLPDVWEEQVFGDTAQTGDGDADSDGLSNGDEFNFGSDPTIADTDGDGLNDGEEVANVPPTNPLSADTDGDGLTDPVETATGVFVGAGDTGTDPTRTDTDEDGLGDGAETGSGVFVDASDTGTSPVEADTDGDGVSDGQEVRTGTDPHDPDDFLNFLPGLAGWWPFDGNSTDSSGQGNNGELMNGVVYSDDVPALLGGGQSIQLQGGDQHVLVPHNESLNIEVALTISAWVKPVGENGWDGVLAKNPSDNGSASNHAGNYELRIDNETRVLHFLYQRGGVDDTNFHPASVPPIEPDVWTHVAVTAERSGEVRFYVNGELAEVHAAPVSDSFGAVNANPLYIGSRADLFTAFDGFLDDVALFNVALTEEQIQNVMRGDFGGAASDSDGDGMTDAYESGYPFLDPNDPSDAGEDQDGDGLTNLAESQLGTRPDLDDSDADGLPDGVETKTGVFVDASDTGSDPLRVDTDADGLADGDEVNGNNPGSFVSDPNLVDTDGDEFGDAAEVAAGTDPSDPESRPVPEIAALWRFDADGASQADATGNGNAASLGTSVWVDDGERGGAVDLGAGSFLEVADSESVSLAGDLTLAAWIRVTDFSTWRGLLGKTAGNLPAPYDYYLIQGNGVPILYRGDGGGGTFAAVQATAAPTAGVWQHVAVTMSGNTVRHYLNGQPNGMGTLNVAAIADLDGTLRIGSRADDVTQMLGRMDDVAVFAGALSQEQIQDIMNGDFSEFGIGGGGEGELAVVESIAYDADADTIVLTFRSESGATYQVEYSMDLDAWATRTEEVTADGETATFEEALPDDPEGFYRVREKQE